MDQSKKYFVAGHNGMVGSAVTRLLEKRGCENLVLKSSDELDLLDTHAVQQCFETERPDVVIMAAARVGGIKANMDHPAEFLYENLMIQNNMIHQAHLHGVKNFCFLGSSCIYPRDCEQPMREEYLLGGSLEPTNEGYALAKIAGLKLIEYYRKQYGLRGFSLMPCNLYGTNDSFDPEHSHVLSALVKKLVDAEANNIPYVTLWGTGVAKREFMHVEDAAEAILFYLENQISEPFINIGWGVDISIFDLAHKIANFSNYKGELRWDESMPDGMLRKCMNVSKMKQSGFYPRISLDDGIRMLIDEYKQIKNGIVGGH